MRYLLKQKFWSWGDDFTIRNEQNEEVFFVDGKAFSWGDKLSFQDMKGHELALIRQKMLAWGPTYEIEKAGQVVAIVKKHLFTFLRCRFTIDVEGPNDLEAAGNFLDHEYTFERAGQVIAQVSKRWFSWTDTYGIEVTPGQDDIIVLASAVVIDMVCHQKGTRH